MNNQELLGQIQERSRMYQFFFSAPLLAFSSHVAERSPWHISLLHLIRSAFFADRERPGRPGSSGSGGGDAQVRVPDPEYLPSWARPDALLESRGPREPERHVPRRVVL
jgi:hypothetical protein